MEKNIVNTTAAPAAIGPYSQGVKENGFLFISGQLPTDPLTGKFPGDGISEQTEQSIKNIAAILESEGLTLGNVIKTTVFLQDMGDFQDMNEVYARFFTEDFPARSTVQVAALPKGALVEIEAIARA